MKYFLMLCSLSYLGDYEEIGNFFSLLSGSSDSTICLWLLENFSLLNTITLPYPVTMLDISSDSVFLVAACEDNQLYLRSLATGTEIHSLRGHKAEVSPLMHNRKFKCPFPSVQAAIELIDVFFCGPQKNFLYTICCPWAFILTSLLWNFRGNGLTGSQ